MQMICQQMLTLCVLLSLSCADGRQPDYMYRAGFGGTVINHGLLT